MILRLQKTEDVDTITDIEISWGYVALDSKGAYVRYIEKGMEFTIGVYYKEIRVSDYFMIHILPR